MLWRFRLWARCSWTAAAAAVRNVSQPRLRGRPAPPRPSCRPPPRRPSSLTRRKTRQPFCPRPARAARSLLASATHFIASSFTKAFRPPSLLLFTVSPTRAVKPSSPPLDHPPLPYERYPRPAPAPAPAHLQRHRCPCTTSCFSGFCFVVSDGRWKLCGGQKD